MMKALKVVPPTRDLYKINVVKGAQRRVRATP